MYYIHSLDLLHPAHRVGVSQVDIEANIKSPAKALSSMIRLGCLGARSSSTNACWHSEEGSKRPIVHKSWLITRQRTAGPAGSHLVTQCQPFWIYLRKAYGRERNIPHTDFTVVETRVCDREGQFIWHVRGNCVDTCIKNFTILAVTLESLFKNIFYFWLTNDFNKISIWKRKKYVSVKL